MKLVVLGLSLGSSWGNGHATTFRALLRAFAARGHDILFLEREVPWYSGAHRDLVDPDFCRLAYYRTLGELDSWKNEIAGADAVVVGSYVPDGVAVGRFVQAHARGVKAFYDIDTPVTLAKLERGDHEYLSPEIIPGYDLYLSFTGGPTLRRLEDAFGAPMARALYCSVDPQDYQPLNVPKRWDLTYLGTYSPDRQPTLERLLLEPARQYPQLRFAVAGPQYPKDIDWPSNVERIEHLPPAEHAAFYSASRMTLNVTREDMIAAGWSPSVRLFEAAACGTPILSDRWEGIDSVLEPGTEILLADTGEQAAQALAQPAEEIGLAARRRVLSAHTAAHRAREMEDHINEARMQKPAATQERNRPMPQGQERLTLVAGGAGFIGSHLCAELLARGEHVVCLDNLQTARPSNLRKLEEHPNFEFIEADIVNPLPREILYRTGRFDRIYNLACAASPPQYQADPEHTMLTCVVGTDNLLRLAEASGARFLLTSTSEVYGDPEVHPQREDYRGWVSCTGPRACYDEGKRAAEAMAFDFARMKRADVRVARIFNTYGPHMHPDDGRVVSNLICQALSGRDVTIYGDGSQTRSFCYVSDMVDGLIRLMESEIDGLEPINLGNPEERTVIELLDSVLATLGRTANVTHLPLPVDDPRRRRPDISRARALLDWQPRMPLAEGLIHTCQWFAEEICGDAQSGLGSISVAAE
ncbi:MAG: NAD-dependent dehydratase [Novosphingobium lindaniclasticum]|jgi:nucleoside-diphosphate-sugar epimerase/spore maturation protein CgeB|uniref:bifunctional glycosyltransferase/UDP-glucuronate decarboxylase n=1 Tax=Novosphingobium lindaniclasticum TaxID=1329895 RepID=UPI0030C73CA2|nr:NAD-dependent dehydratase [Novosphingobium lindaniclasticum]